MGKWLWIVSLSLMFAALIAFLAVWFTTPPLKPKQSSYAKTADPFAFVPGSIRPAASDLSAWKGVLPAPSNSGLFLEYPSAADQWKGVVNLQSNGVLLWYLSVAGEQTMADALASSIIKLAAQYRYHETEYNTDAGAAAFELFTPYYNGFNGIPISDIKRVNTTPSLHTTVWTALGLAKHGSYESRKLAIALWRVAVTRCGTAVTNAFDDSKYMAFRQSDKATTGHANTLGIPLDTSLFAATDTNVLFTTLTKELSGLALFPNQWKADAATTVSNIASMVKSLNHKPTLPDACTTISHSPQQLQGQGFTADTDFQSYNYYYTGYLQCQSGSIQRQCQDDSTKGKWVVNCTVAPPYHTSTFLYLQSEHPPHMLRESVEYLTTNGSVADADIKPLGCGSIYSEDAKRLNCNAKNIKQPLVRYGMKYSLNGDGIDIPTTAMTTMALFHILKNDSNQTVGQVFDQFLNSILLQFRSQTRKKEMMIGSYREEKGLPGVATNTGYPDQFRVGFIPCLAGHVWTGMCLQYINSKANTEWNPFFVR
jgi:hypothetical protein